MKNIFVGVVLSFFSLIACAFAQEFHVNDPTSFQTALTTASSNGEDDVIYVAPGTYNLSATLGYGTNDGDGRLVITAEDPNNMPVLDGGSTIRILGINNDLNDNGSGDTNDHISISFLVFQNGHITDGGNGRGGGLAIKTGGSNISVSNCRFQNNFADDRGGGVALSTNSGDISLSGNVLSSNVATNYGGGGSISSSSGSVSILNNNEFNRNVVNEEAGGGLFVFAYNGPVEVARNSFQNNSVTTNNRNTGGGGLVIFSSTSSIQVHDNTFANNSAGRKGGGARIGTSDGGSINISHNTFTDNRAINGKGGGLSAGTYARAVINVSENNFMNNSAGDDGGGLFVGLDISSSFPSSTGDGTANAFNNTFYGNSAADKGGAFKFRSYHGTINVTNNTAYVNSANYGGGLNVKLIYDDARANVYNNIIYNNDAAGNGDDIYINSDAEPDQNGNTVGNGTGSPVAIFNNDISPDNNDFSGSSPALLITDTDNYTHGGNIDGDPALAGPSSGDFHLTSASPCIDAGTNSAPALPTQDFEGQSRVSDGNGDGTAIVDIGADEVSAAAVIVPTMNQWGLITMVILFATVSLLTLRKNTIIIDN